MAILPSLILIRIKETQYHHGKESSFLGLGNAKPLSPQLQQKMSACMEVDDTVAD